MLCPPGNYREIRRRRTLSRQEMKTRVVRISYTDADATDSSSDEGEEHSFLRPPRGRRFVKEVPIEPCSQESSDVNRPATSPKKKPITVRKKQNKMKLGTAKKFRGVRQRPWGKWIAEIRNPVTRERMWLGTYNTAEEAAIVYDRAAIQLRGSDALTNFLTPLEVKTPPAPEMKPESSASGYSTSRTSQNDTAYSPTSVLVDTQQNQPNDVVAVREDCKQNVSVLGNFSDFTPPGSLFLDDQLFDFHVPFPDLFDGSGLGDIMFDGDCGELLSDFGFGLEQSTWGNEDYLQFQDIGDLFGSDPLLAM
ncbi:hypothetical protein NMG60_11030511 [Bertholletia excelsa]